MLKQSLESARFKEQAQESCLDLCEAALRVQEEAVGWLPELVEKERQRAAAAQRQMEENAEAASRLQAEFEERLRRQDGELSIAQRKALAAEERIAALHETMQAQQTRAAERTEAELAESRRREQEATSRA